MRAQAGRDGPSPPAYGNHNISHAPSRWFQDASRITGVGDRVPLARFCWQNRFSRILYV